jgi:hypothetical protein
MLREIFAKGNCLNNISIADIKRKLAGRICQCWKKAWM